jgi:transposase
MRHLSEVQVVRAVALIQHAHSIRHVSGDLRVSPSVIQRLWNRFRETGQYVRRAGQGRNRKTTQNQDRFLVLFSLRKRTATARDLLNDLRRAHGIEISDQTVRNRLKEANLKPRRPVRASRLTQHHKAARMSCSGSQRLATSSLDACTVYRRAQISFNSLRRSSTCI